MCCGISCCARFRLGRMGVSGFDALVQRYNSDLANGYGNLVSRTLSMIQQYFSPYDAVDGEVERNYNHLRGSRLRPEKIKAKRGFQ